jgi:murein L,D-transpeptidase YcbB/YkuD
MTMSRSFPFFFALLTAAAVPALAAEQGAASDPYQLPAGGEAGLDMAVVDAEALPEEPELADERLFDMDEGWSGAPVDLMRPVHPLYTELRRALVRYQLDWGSLPRMLIPEKGPALAPGSSDQRAAILRQRLGLSRLDPLSPSSSPYDWMVEEKVRDFQAAHGLPIDGKAGPGTLEALNRGPGFYERLIAINLERARRLPAPGTANARKYILVDAAAARLWMFEDGQPVGSMKVVVGTAQSPTPMMAALMRYVNVNPYWNLPPDLVAKLVAPNVIRDGTKFLADKRYEVLDSWEDDAKVIDPSTVDWKAVASGKIELRVRQLPGGSNFMGDIKFMLPNHYGIYLHDTPAKELMNKEDRHLSNGCVRLEDARGLASWLFGEMPRASSENAEQRVDLPTPVPVYITYLTAGITPEGRLAFAPDTYGRDSRLLARFDPLAPRPASAGGR